MQAVVARTERVISEQKLNALRMVAGTLQLILINLQLDQQRLFPVNGAPPKMGGRIIELSCCYQYAVQPPSVAYRPPVRLEASSDSRKQIIAACSQTVA